jgi:hypothetical protein
VYAVFSFIAIIVLTNTPLGLIVSGLFGPATTDMATIAANYLLITGPVAFFAPLLVGNYIYDPRQWGPILRPVVWGRGLRRSRFPDITIIGLFSGLATIVALDYALTYGGFVPTLSFWNTLTNRIVYSDGGIFEELIFRLVFYGTINRFPGVGRVLLDNPVGFLAITAPADSAAFLIYHLKVYASSTLSLSLVFAESYVLNLTYRGLKYPLWVVMVMHALINWAAAP